MDLNEFFETINKELIAKLNAHQGLSIFATQKAKFEGWLKVELIGILKNNNPIPEDNWVDIVFKNTYIELKTINTNYQYQGVTTKGKPITKNIQGIINDIEKLKKKTDINGFVLFVAFPCKQEDKRWQKHLQKIQTELSDIKSQDFLFNNNIPGIVYYGKV